MRLRNVRRASALAAALIALPRVVAANQPPLAAAASPPLPVAAAVRLADADRNVRFEYDARDYFLPNPSCTVDLASQTLDAYANTASTAFSAPPGAAAALDLEVTVARSEVVQTGTTGTASVEHTVVLRVPSGPELDRWRLVGEAAIVGLDADGIRSAFARATRAAASGLHRAASSSAPLIAWLASRGIAASPAAPEPQPPPPPPPPHPRGRWVAFLDAGGEALATSLDAVEFPATLRGGVSGRWFLAQAAFDRWRVGSSATAPGSYDTTHVRWDVSSVGVDVGGVVRLARSHEYRGGVGVRYVYGRVDVPSSLPYASGGGPWQTTIDRSRVSTSFFLGYQWRAGVWTQRRIGLRFGVEIRKHFGATLPADHFAQDLETADVAVGFTVGAELPIGRAPEADEARAR